MSLSNKYPSLINTRTPCPPLKTPSLKRDLPMEASHKVALSENLLFITALAEALRPNNLPDRSAVADFPKKHLKHVETKEKNVIPDKDGTRCF